MPLDRAASKPLVDHRIYTIRLRKMGEFIEVFDRLAMPILLQTLGTPLGFWTSLVGPQNQFIHCWGYDSLADYEQRSQARDTHPDFPKYLAASALAQNAPVMKCRGLMPVRQAMPT